MHRDTHSYICLFCCVCLKEAIMHFIKRLLSLFFCILRLCLDYTAKGGGYLKAKDRRNNQVLPAVPYTKTWSTHQICYRFDDVPSEHCFVNGSCTFEPLHVDKRISRNSVHTVTFCGWSDPVPLGGSLDTASKIEHYVIRVNEVIPSKGTNKVDYTTNVLSVKVNTVTTEMTLNLPTDKPHLYCVTLEVKDVADNPRQCRRFVLTTPALSKLTSIFTLLLRHRKLSLDGKNTQATFVYLGRDISWMHSTAIIHFLTALGGSTWFYYWAVWTGRWRTTGVWNPECSWNRQIHGVMEIERWTIVVRNLNPWFD